MISQLSPQRRSLLATIGFATGAVLFLVLFFKPRHEAIGVLRAELSEKRQYLDATGAVSDSVRLANRDLEAVKDYVQQWESRSPDRARLAGHFAEIAREGKAAGVVINKFDPQDVEQLRSIWRAPVQLTVEGDYEQIFDFVHRLERLRVTAWIDQLRIETLRDGSDSRTDDSDAGAEGLLRCELDWVVFADYPDSRDYSADRNR